MRGSSPSRLRDCPVVILGSLFPALGTLHALTAKGVDCSVCCWERGVASWSRHARFVRIPDPRIDDRGMVECLLRLSKQVGGTPVLIPTDDYYAQALAKHRSDLEDAAIPCVADRGTVELLVSQLEFSEWGAANAISSPRAAQASDPDMALSLPLVAKPINKSAFRLIAQASGEDVADFRFALLATEEQLKSYMERHSKHLSHIVLQEFIPGTTAEMYSIGIYADRNSDILGIFVGRKIRGYPAMYGNTKLGQNDWVPSAVLDEVRSIVRRLAYTGIAEFEYRRDLSNGDFRLIEINPRCWSWIGVTAFSEANIPWIAYQDLIGLGTTPVVDNASPGRLKYVQIMSDCANVFFRYRWDHPAWLLGPRSWWNSLKAERLMVAEFHRGDWPIALVCFAMLFKNAGLRIRKRLAQELTPALRLQRRDVRDVVSLAFQAACAWIVPERHWHPLCRQFARWEMRWQKDRVRRSCKRIRAACQAQPIALDPLAVETERIAGRHYERLIIFGSYRPGGWGPRIELHGRERLDQALAGGRGAILWVSDFTGSALVAKIALHSAGIAITHLSRPTHGFSRTAFGIRFLNPLRSKLERRYLKDRIVIERDDQGRDAMRRLRSTLQENGVVSITVGAWAKRTQLVPLLSGRITYATGPAHLARTTGAPLLPVFAVRDEDGTFHVHIGPALEVPVTDDQTEYERTLLQYVGQLESFIRRYPGQWRTWTRVQPTEAWSVKESLGRRARTAHGTAAMDAVADGPGGEKQ